MPLPDNTLPMMTGAGQFGAIEMGGMFTTVKVRANQAKDDYKDPGDYQFPKNTVAYEWTGESMNPITAPTSRGGDIDAATGKVKDMREMTVTVRKPNNHTGHH
jgi:manganese oxidase